MNECAIPGVCQNNGHCINKYGSFHCICDDKLYSGDRCQHDIDDCIENICYRGSKCVDRSGFYECLCADDRMGKFRFIKFSFIYLILIIGLFCEDEKPCYGDNNKCIHGTCLEDYTCNCDNGFEVIIIS